MTELAVRDNGTVVVAPDTPRRLVEWAQEAQAAHNLATALCETSFVPDAFRRKPGEATAAILAGSELGLSPMASLNAYDVIQGRPAPKAITLRALVQSKGHDVWVESATDAKVVMGGRRKGSDRVQTSEWTTARAQRLQLTGKPNWKNQPQNMLIARATSEICRLIAADVILGIPYSAEELADLDPEPTVTVRRDDAPTRTARRAQPAAPPPAEEPPLDPPLPSGTTPEPEAVAYITAPQLKKLHAALGDIGVKDRDAAHAWMSEHTGRPIASAKDLTKDEASRLIDGLENPPAVVEDPPYDDGAWMAGGESR